MMYPVETVLSPEAERILSDPDKLARLLRDLKETNTKAMDIHQHVRDAGLEF